jgi:hypothetical protein
MVNFREAHEAADGMIQDMIKRFHITEILEES